MSDACVAYAGLASNNLRQVRVLLPDALQAKPKRARAGVRARTGSGALARTAIKLTRDGDLRLTLTGAARTVNRGDSNA